MRLTLRTLLAYMDDVLDPADQEDLGRKIEASPFATELIHRSRDAVRRLRLSAPEVMAGESGDIHGDSATLDANTTAEYLDSTLSPDAVAEFERSCLEAGNNADMLLAEAASCHHILTMVLGEPAEVDADLRQRLYALAQSPAATAQQVRIEPAHATPSAAATAAVTPPLSSAPAAPPAAPRPPQVDPDEASVPDYMLAAARQRRRSRRAIVAALLAFVLGGVVVWLAWPDTPVEAPSEVADMGDLDDITAGVEIGEFEATVPADSNSLAASSTDEGAATEAPANVAADAPAAAAPTLPPLDLAAAPGAEVGAAAGEVAAASGAAEATPVDAAAVAAAGEAGAASAVEDEVPDASEMTLGPAIDPADAADEVAAAEAPAEVRAPADVTPTDVPLVTPTTPEVDAPPAVVADAAVGAVDAGSDPVRVADASSAMAADAPVAGPPLADPFPGEEASAAQEVKPIGLYLGNNDVLLRLDPQENVWKRVPPRTPLVAGEQLLSLPTFRTHVVLADANVYLSGGTEVEVLPPGAGAGSEAAEFSLRIPFGQVILNSGLNGNRIELATLDQSRLVQLDPSSSLAVEVRRIFVPGPAIERQPAPLEATWYLTSGSVQWNGEKIEAPAMWTTADGADGAAVAIEKLPEWVDREPISSTERSARDVVAAALVPGEPVNIRLLELSDRTDRGRRTEVRALAARCGAYVGLYDALVAALNDLTQRASWRSQVEELRQAIARDPSSAEGIGEAFALERGQEAADDLMEMLQGFNVESIGTTREEVQNGALVRIIRWMNDDDLTYRVLASQNWDEITGKRNLGNYRPEQSDAQRQRALRHHWERLERGELATDAGKSP